MTCFYRLSLAVALFAVVCAFPVCSEGASIALVTQDAARDADLIAHLEAAGHTVSTGGYSALDTTPADIATLNSADLVLVSRNSNSGDYASNVDEVAAWDSLTAPVILGNAYISRSNRWSWVSTEAIQTDYGLDTSAPVGTSTTHPYYAGALPNEDYLTDPGASPPISGLMKYRPSNSTDIPDGGAVMGDGVTIGVRNNASLPNVYIASWNAGEMTGSGNVLGSDRVFYALPEDYSNFQPAGITIFDNIVNSTLGIPEPSSLMILGLCGLAAAVGVRSRRGS